MLATSAEPLQFRSCRTSLSLPPSVSGERHRDLVLNACADRHVSTGTHGSLQNNVPILRGTRRAQHGVRAATPATIPAWKELPDDGCTRLRLRANEVLTGSMSSPDIDRHGTTCPSTEAPGRGICRHDPASGVIGSVGVRLPPRAPTCRRCQGSAHTNLRNGQPQGEDGRRDDVSRTSW